MISECLAVEFRVAGDDCPLADAAAATGTTVDCESPQLRTDGNVLLRFSAPADDDLAATLDADERIRYLHVSESNGRYNFRCLSKQPCVVHALTDAGFMSETLQYHEGVERYTGAVVGHDVLKGVLDTAGDTVGVTLERIYPLGPKGEEAVAQRWDVTPAQEEAVRAAMELGYFEVPRTTTASEVAAELGVSKSAFLERLHRAQNGLFRQVFA